MNGTLATLVVRIGADVSKMVAGMSQASAATTRFGSNVSGMGQKMATAGRGMTTGLTLPIVGVGYKAIKSAAEYEKAMNTMAIVSDIPMKKMKEMDRLAIKLGQDTIFSAQEAAASMVELAKGGITPAQIQAGALASTLDLAAAADMGLADASKILVRGMNTFNLTGKDSGRVADALAGAANASSADLGDLALALSQGGASADRYNLTIEETAGLLAKLSDEGIRGSDAGTLLKSQLRTLVPITEKARGKMREMGLEFFDAKGQFIGIAGVANELQKEFGGLSDKQRELALNQIFGSDASRLAGALAEEGAAGFREYVKAAGASGVASETAAAKMKGLPGALEKLRGSLETAVLTFGDAIAPHVKKVARFIKDLVDRFAELSPKTKRMVAGIALATAAFGPLLFIGGKILKVFGGTISMFGKVGTAIFGTCKAAHHTKGCHEGLIGFIRKAPSKVKSAYETIALRAMYMKDGVVRAFNLTRDKVGLALTYLKSGVTKFATGAKAAMITAMTGIKTAVTSTVAFLMANPWVLAVAAVIATAVLIIKNWDKVKAFLIAAWNVIKAAAGKIWGAIKGAISTVWNAIKGIIKGAVNFIKGLIAGYFNLYKTLITGAWNAIKAIFTTALNAIKTAWSAAWNALRSVLSAALIAIKNAVSSGISAVVSFFSGLPSRIVSALGDLAGMLFDVGKNAIRGLLDGLKSLVTGGQLSAVTADIVKQVKDDLGEKSPSKVFHGIGKDAMLGFNLGMRSVAAATPQANRPTVKAQAIRASTDAMDRQAWGMGRGRLTLDLSNGEAIIEFIDDAAETSLKNMNDQDRVRQGMRGRKAG